MKSIQYWKRKNRTKREQIKIRASTLEEYFPDDFTPKQKVELIERLVKEWHEKQIKDKERNR